MYSDHKNILTFQLISRTSHIAICKICQKETTSKTIGKHIEECFPEAKVKFKNNNEAIIRKDIPDKLYCYACNQITSVNVSHHKRKYKEC